MGLFCDGVTAVFDQNVTDVTDVKQQSKIPGSPCGDDCGLTTDVINSRTKAYLTASAHV